MWLGDDQGEEEAGALAPTHAEPVQMCRDGGDEEEARALVPHGVDIESAATAEVASSRGGQGGASSSLPASLPSFTPPSLVYPPGPTACPLQ